MPKKTMSIINLLLPAAGSIVVKDTGIPHDIGRICRSCVVERGMSDLKAFIDRRATKRRAPAEVWLCRGKLFSQQCHDGRFYRFSAPHRTVADCLSINVRFEYRRVNIRLTTHGRGVPQALRYRLESPVRCSAPSPANGGSAGSATPLRSPAESGGALTAARTTEAAPPASCVRGESSMLVAQGSRRPKAMLARAYRWRESSSSGRRTGLAQHRASRDRYRQRDITSETRGPHRGFLPPSESR